MATGAAAAAGAGPASTTTTTTSKISQPATVPAQMGRETALLEALTSIPLISKAVVRAGSAGGSAVDINVVATQHNLPANSKRQLQFSVVVPDASQPQPLVSRLPTELQPSQLHSVSPSGCKALIARAHTEGGVLLELWADGRLVKELLVPKSLHGPVICDGWFARGAAWNPAEDIVVYVAEAPPTEQTPAFGSSNKDSESAQQAGGGAGGAADSKGAAPRTWRGVAAATEDWGELNTDKRPPALYALNTSIWQVHALHESSSSSKDQQEQQQQQEELSWGQPVWAPDGRGVVAVAWPHRALNFPERTARRLGIVHCYNRPCSLMYIPYVPPAPAAAAATAGSSSSSGNKADARAAAAVPVLLTRGLDSALSPVFSPDGSQLLFVSQAAAVASGVHAATSALYKLPWPAAAAAAGSGVEPQCVVPVVARPAAPGALPGLYAFSLAEQAFLGGDASTLLITSQWYSQTAILAVDVATGAVTPVTPVADAADGSWSLQGVCNGLAVATLSAPHHPPKLMLAPVPRDASSEWAWAPVTALEPDLSGLPSDAGAAVQGVRCQVLDVAATEGDASLPMQAIVLVSKAASGPCPAIVVPHGGPHTALPASYLMPYTFLTALGYCIVAPNYRGSLGFGEDGVQSLPGRIGSQDVSDCLAALDAAVAAGLADGARAAVCGGSHGGFLTGHLLGQHPQRFKCGALRNPVLNLALMVGVTDIPDWCFVETYGTQEGRARFSAEPSPEDLARMHAVSPVAHIARVASPMLFLLGAKDRRVPLDDGRRYVDALRTRGVEARVLVFPDDTHALDKPQTEVEQWLNIAWWMQRFL